MEIVTSILQSSGVATNYLHFLSFLISFCIIVLIAYIAHLASKIYLIRLLRKSNQLHKHPLLELLLSENLTKRISHLIPAIIIYKSAPLLEVSRLSVDDNLIKVLQAIMLLYILVACILVFNVLMSRIEFIYKKQKGAKRKSIKSYLQVARIVFYFISAIIAVSIIINKSPIALFTGLGAMAAILLLVFKDTISGFVASVQLSSYDMARVGDWVVLPKYGADGDVIEISLNTVKIQNFDKTITTVPTAALLSEGMTNWRGMQESGGRRIKRSIYIDMKSIKFCDEPLLKKLSNLHFLKEYIENKTKEIKQHNESFNISAEDSIANGRHLTNIGLFRAYVEKYIHAHPNIHKEMTILIRQLQPTETGLPLELYIFTNDTNWNRYEGIQADIFDHLLSSLGEFDLHVFQNFSGKEVSVHVDNKILT